MNLFRGRSPQVGWQRVFGGQVIGQALVAACRTVESRRRRIRCTPISCCAGDPKVPIIYDVDRIRDGKSFTTRRVIAIQHGQPIFSMSVSFHADEDRLRRIRPRCRTCRRRSSCRARPRCARSILPMMPDPVRRYYERERPIELRPVEFERYLGKKFDDGQLQRLDPHHRRGCRTIRRSINACWPMPPT